MPRAQTAVEAIGREMRQLEAADRKLVVKSDALAKRIMTLSEQRKVVLDERMRNDISRVRLQEALDAILPVDAEDGN